MSDDILQVTPEHLEGLPPELLAELALSDAEKADFEVLTTMRGIKRAATLDAILIAHYKRTDEVMARNALSSRLTRLAGRDLVTRVEGKQGVYQATTPPTLTDRVDEPNSFEPDGDEASAG